jgi:hypothetical protein
MQIAEPPVVGSALKCRRDRVINITLKRQTNGSGNGTGTRGALGRLGDPRDGLQ